MPYFIYRISPEKVLHCLDKHEKYRPAREHVRELRKQQEADDKDTIRLIHASNETEAERLLLTPREAPVEGDD